MWTEGSLLEEVLPCAASWVWEHRPESRRVASEWGGL